MNHRVIMVFNPKIINLVSCSEVSREYKIKDYVVYPKHADVSHAKKVACVDIYPLLYKVCLS